MTAIELEQTASAWETLRPFLTMPQSEAEFDRLVDFLNTLIDTVGEDESHPLASLMDAVGQVVEAYEERFVPEL
ncbi:MAG: hypothetical protein ACFB9N_15275 [Geitlerinemataceae cyanobacterium]